MSRACTPILVGVVSPVFEIWLPFKNGQISLSRHGLYSPWSWKNLIDQNRLKKLMQVGIDVKCMHTDFGGCGLSGFGDKISLKSIKVEKFNRSESAQKIHATRGQCHVNVHKFWWAWSLRFRRYGYLSKTTKFPFRGMDYRVHGHRKIQSIGIGSKNLCK